MVVMVAVRAGLEVVVALVAEASPVVSFVVVAVAAVVAVVLEATPVVPFVVVAVAAVVVVVVVEPGEFAVVMAAK